ncbi:MAG: WbqC-like protein [Herbaspirillum sp.]|jgi:hypothetical protein|nr:WbqC-like protein [Herbaspirillum sp.]
MHRPRIEGMKIAVMQPYFFPYIGYWQLIHEVDCFVIFDDVNYINKGWINRNRLLINGEPAFITLPLQGASQNKKICDIDVCPASQWLGKLSRTVELTYKKAPCFQEVFPLVGQLLAYERTNLADYLAHHLQTLARFIGIDTRFVVTSRGYGNADLAAQERIIDICKREQSTVYINPQGGQALYDPAQFRDAGIDLRFLAMRPVAYPQRTNGFVPNLSIIDALMEIGPEAVKRHLGEFTYL